MREYTQEELALLRQHYAYDAKTGVITSRRTGKPVGYKNQKGYLRIDFRGKLYRAHHIAWAFVMGEWPESMLDHINQIKDDNRIENLRLATMHGNNVNRGVQSNNTSGFRGVSWVKRRQKWRAMLYLKPKRKHLGYFDTAEEAGLAQYKALMEMNPEFMPDPELLLGMYA